MLELPPKQRREQLRDIRCRYLRWSLKNNYEISEADTEGLARGQLLDWLERLGYYGPHGRHRDKSKVGNPNTVSRERLAAIAKWLPVIDEKGLKGAAAGRFLAEHGVTTRNGSPFTSGVFYRMRDIIEGGAVELEA